MNSQALHIPTPWLCTLCFIFRVPLAKKSINVICRSVSKFAGCQIKGMTTGKIYTQGFFPRLLQTGIAWRWLTPLRNGIRVLDWYKKMHFCPFTGKKYFFNVIFKQSYHYLRSVLVYGRSLIYVAFMYLAKWRQNYAFYVFLFRARHLIANLLASSPWYRKCNAFFYFFKYGQKCNFS